MDAEPITPGAGPHVSVLMAVYNGERYLNEAIKSIVNQTFTDFEFVIVDDGSTDYTNAILRACPDQRIRRVQNQRNVGFTASLNRGLGLCRGTYIARIDADDTAVPDRLARQVEFLESHPDVGILGSFCRQIDASGRDLGLATVPEDDLSIQWAAILNNPFLHPTVMLRRSVVAQHDMKYDERFRTAQDYELWTRLLRVTHGANLREALVTSRVGSGVTANRRAEQLHNHDMIVRRTLGESLPRERVTVELASQLRSFSAEKSEFVLGVAADGVELARVFTETLRAFVASHSERGGVDDLSRRETRRVAKLLDIQRSGWRKVAVTRGLVRMNPELRPLLRTTALEALGYWAIRKRLMRLRSWSGK